ncbi:MAG: hypothetical protein E7029_08415 [Planctomycetaceae bacterium]|nr:hypothetical protein [Planctomycetaceae bacterium]
MNKKSFHRKTLLKGFGALLALAVSSQAYAQGAPPNLPAGSTGSMPLPVASGAAGNEYSARISETGASAYVQPASYGGNSAYTQNAAYGRSSAYTQNAAYGGNSAYTQNAAYGGNSAYTQNAAYGGSSAYTQNAAYGGDPVYVQTVSQTQAEADYTKSPQPLGNTAYTGTYDAAPAAELTDSTYGDPSEYYSSESGSSFYGLSIRSSCCGDASCGHSPCDDASCFTCGSESGCMEEPDGLVFHRFNHSPMARAGSAFLGPGAFFIDGHISQGITYGNADGKNLAPLGMNDREGYQMNQLYLSLGRKVERADQFAFGGQIDIMYGTDYYYMSASGLETRSDNSNRWNSDEMDPFYRSGHAKYGFALPQFFGEIYAPILNGLSVKVGHFDSVMGFESLRSDQNFFYSHSYSRLYGMPTSMTGAIATAGLVNGWSLVFGAVNEWNSFDAVNDNFSAVLGLNFENCDRTFNFAAAVMYGQQTAPCYHFATLSEDETDVLIFNTHAKFQLTQRLSYACEFTFGYDERDYLCLEIFGSKHGRAWYGLTNYLFFDVCENLTLGARFEWFNDADNTVIDGGYGFAVQDDAANYFALTLGANWTPLHWLTIRPEVRYDFSDFEVGELKSYDSWTSDDMVTFGADILVRF